MSQPFELGGARSGQQYSELFRWANTMSNHQLTSNTFAGGLSGDPDNSNSDNKPPKQLPWKLPLNRPHSWENSAISKGSVVSRYQTLLSTPLRSETMHFKLKLKMDTVPYWNGNADKLARWMMKVNQIAKQSKLIFRQLEVVVPQQFKGATEDWYYSIYPEMRDYIETD